MDNSSSIENYPPATQSHSLHSKCSPLTLEEIVRYPQNREIMARLKKETEDYVKNTSETGIATPFSFNKIKKLVSQNKNRFCFGTFDLDLSYITPNIIAMGLPSTFLQGLLFRNNMEDVKRFFNTRHNKSYKVYNLCNDKAYPPDMFYKQETFPFKDHEAPPLDLILPFCKNAAEFLRESTKNVVAIHCLAGKGRTGTFISCLMYYLGLFPNVTEALRYYGVMRVDDGRGVTVPSQIRYAYYFESLLKNQLIIDRDISYGLGIKITKIKMITIPSMSNQACSPNFVIEGGDKPFRWNENCKERNGYPESNPYAEFNILPYGGYEVKGDVRIMFEHYNVIIKNEPMFKFWFNTLFIPPNGVFVLKKDYIDKACKDTQCKRFKKNFAVEVHYEFISENKTKEMFANSPIGVSLI